MTITVTGNDITCNGAGDGTASVTANDGTGPYTYLWSTSATTTSVTGLGAGVTTVAVTDSCGVVVNGSVTIIDPAGITITSQDTVDITCNGAGDGQITIVASGGTSPLGYSITGSAPFTNTTGVFQNLPPGTYFVVVQDASSCQMLGDTLNISEPAAISIDSAVAFDVVGCPNDQTGMIVIVASGGTGPFTYSIDGGTNYTSSGTFTVLGTGTYAVQVMDAANCVMPGPTLTINEPPSIVIDTDLSTPITCNGANDGTITIVASGGQSALTYSIDNGVTDFPTGVFTNLPPGTYDVIVKDTLCFVFGNVYVLTDPPGITISSETPTDINCFEDADGAIAIVANGGTPPLVYSIDGGTNYTNNAGSFTNLAAGTYNIAVQDSNGCTEIGSALTITEPASAVSLSDSLINVTGCFGDETGAIYLAGSGGTGSLVFSIDSGVTFDAGLGDFPNLVSGTYNLEVQDGNGCSAALMGVYLSEPQQLDIGITNQVDPSKGKCDGTITILPIGGTPGYTYLWDDSANQTNGTATELCGGKYVVEVKDANGCVDTLSIFLVAPDNDLFIPTAFSPNGDGENDKFKVRGSLTSMTMVIYNRWGEKIFESSDQDKGWDGTFNQKDAISDSYGYYIVIVKTDGITEKFKGDILLVR